MRHSRSLIALCAVGLIASAAHAHLRAVGGSFLDLLVRGDAVVLVDVMDATEDPPRARTPMRVVEVLGGAGPEDEFLLRNAPSPMRYAKGQKALVVVKREGETWQAIQLAGEGVVFEGDAPGAPTRAYVEALWKATRDADPDGDLGDVLRRGIRLPHQKLRLFAALDLAELAHHQPGLSDRTQAGLRADMEDPDLDPVVRVALSRALGKVR